jgi:hypothetical protein
VRSPLVKRARVTSPRVRDSDEAVSRGMDRSRALGTIGGGPAMCSRRKPCRTRTGSAWAKPTPIKDRSTFESRS